MTSLPKTIGFKLVSGKDWFTEYAWLSIPDVQLDHAAPSAPDSKRP